LACPRGKTRPSALRKRFWQNLANQIPGYSPLPNSGTPSGESNSELLSPRGASEHWSSRQQMPEPFSPHLLNSYEINNNLKPKAKISIASLTDIDRAERG
ncbi:MAG: hypothetical protein IJJ33_20845, partial [Victivallales bacterium]|nr:hypothetical protein [Victivallales bacterium]